MRQIRETTAIAKAGEILQWQWILMVGGGGGGGVKGWHAARALYLHRRNVLFLLRRTKIFFERSKNNIDLH